MLLKHQYLNSSINKLMHAIVCRYIKVVGGLAGREGLLLGLKDGQIVSVYVDNPFPVLLVTHHASVR